MDKEERVLKYIKVLSMPIFTIVLMAVMTLSLCKTDINWWVFSFLNLPFFFISIWIFRRCLKWVLLETKSVESPDYIIDVIDISLQDSNINSPYFRIFYDNRGKILSIYRLNFYEVKAPELDKLQKFYSVTELNEQSLINLIANYIENDEIK